MKKNQNFIFQQKEYLSKDDYNRIQQLQKLCSVDLVLKLELDYRFACANENKEPTNQVNEFMCFDGQLLVGYIGIACFGGDVLEVCGMVHPDYRRCGIFKALFDLVKTEWKKRPVECMLLLADRNSKSGQAFIKSTGATYANSEYEMVIDYISELAQVQEQGTSKTAETKSGVMAGFITLRKATNADANQIAYQNTIYFGHESKVILPEEEEKRGMTIYLAQNEDVVIGKVHIEMAGGTGAIFGLGVLPEYRSKGYGRKILLEGIEVIKKMPADRALLQVATENSNALNLYLSCGFVEKAIMDYFELYSIV